MPDQRYALRKRKIPIDEKERILKIAKAIIALINLLEDDTELALLAAKHDLEIPIPRTYDEAVNDPNYGQQWKDAIWEEINSLVANRTWTEEIRP